MPSPLLFTLLSSPAAKPLAAQPPGPTAADVNALNTSVGFRPDTPVEEGVRRLIGLYREYSAG